MKTNANTAAVTAVKPEELNEDEAAVALAQARQAKTPLGRRLWELRARIVASGAPLLSWDELEREVEERRGGSRRDDE